jgi:pimeloyl-ACP methyl ester carboxylesterase
VARALGGNPLFRWLSGDAGAKLTSPEFYRRLPLPDVPTLVIAGDRGPSAPWLPFGGSANDGIVRVAEARLPGVPLVVVHGAHTFLMNRRDVVRAVLQFLDAERIAMPPAAPGRHEPVSAAACAPSPAPASSPGKGC